MREIVKPIFSIWTGLVLLGLYGPFLAMAVLSFTGPQGRMTFPLQNPGVYWYEFMFGLIERPTSDPVSEQYGGALVRSLIVALIVTAISTILALTSAQAFRNKFRGSGPVFYLFLLGIITPGATIGLGQAFLYEFVVSVDKYWLTTTLIAHITWTFPFCFLVLMIYFNRFDRSVEEAAASLGASPWTVYRTVTLPMIVPALLACVLFSFTLSFDEFARSTWLIGFEQTIPTMILGAQGNLLLPTVYVAGSLTTAFSLAIVVLFLLLIQIRMARTKIEPGERLQEEAA